MKASEYAKLPGTWPGIRTLIEKAIAEEREACLRIVDEYVGDYGETWERPVVYIHNAIRERGQSGQTGPVS